MHVLLRSAPPLGRGERAEHQARVRDMSTEVGKNKNKEKIAFKTVRIKFVRLGDFKNSKFKSDHIGMRYKTGGTHLAGQSAKNFF